MAGQIAKWALVALIALGSIITVTRVGKPRTPTGGGEAAMVVVFNALIIAAIVAWWG